MRLDTPGGRARATVPSSTLWRTSWRYLRHRPWQTVLMIIGIALGVAVAVAIDLANVSASRAFDLSATAVTGNATHDIAGGPNGIDETLYVRLRQQAVAPSAPVIVEYVASPELGGAPLQLLGIDPFAEAPFRSYLFAQGALPLARLGSFFTAERAVLISTGLAEQYSLQAGSEITLTVLGKSYPVIIVGLLRPADSLSSRLLDGLVLADIATAQELTGRLGRIDRIDLILPAAGRSAADIAALLPPGVRIAPVQARSGAVEQMTAAFRTNLTALSLLALLVGMFLIYNTMTFSVVQRRSLLGTLRCLGVTRSEVFLLVLGEALLVGIVGSALGVGLGIVLGKGSVRLITQTINDLYFVVNVRDIELPLSTLAKGALLGILATVVTAAPPAWEAASVPPRLALSRSGLETKAHRAIVLAAAVGVVGGAGGAVLLALPTRSLVVSFAGTSSAVIGAAMLTPLTMEMLMGATARLTGRLWRPLGRMAPRNVVAALSRTSVAIAALMIAVSVAIGVSVMVSSFRYTVTSWLGQILQGDIYISAPSITAATPSTALEPAVLEIARGWPGVARVDSIRAVGVDSPLGPVQITAFDNPDFGREHAYLTADYSPAAIWGVMGDGAVVVSEPLANRLGLPRSGASITLATDDGAHTFPVVGIYYDYSSSQGVIAMTSDTYRRYWKDDTVTALVVRLTPSANEDAVRSALQQELAPVQQLIIRPNRALRDDVLIVFERTFAITSALQLLATVVAFVGVLSALLSLELEKQCELGILSAIGMTARQTWALVLLETGLMGAVAGLMAMPTGFAISWILVYIINSRSFGWTLQMQALPAPFVQALLAAVIAALLAGIYPAYRMTHTVTAEAIRFE